MKEMTPEELLAWANGLGICEFMPCKDDARGEIVCERGNARISLEFGRYAMREKEGARFVAVDCPYGSTQTGRICWRNASLDMIARAKKLAGIEEEEQR